MKKTRTSPRINLIPHSGSNLSFEVPRFVLPLPAGMIIIAVLVDGIRVQLALKKSKSSLTSVQTQQAEVTRKLQVLDQKRIEQEQKARQVNAIAKILDRKVQWSDYFKEMSMMTPKSIWLSSMRGSANPDGNLEMLLQGSGDSPRAVSSYYQALEQSFFFKKVMLVSSTLDPKMSPPLYRFKFQCPLGESPWATEIRTKAAKEKEKAKAGTLPQVHLEKGAG